MSCNNIYITNFERKLAALSLLHICLLKINVKNCKKYIVKLPAEGHSTLKVFLFACMVSVEISKAEVSQRNLLSSLKIH